jgi:alkylhydroperoxidase family enzyme
MKHPKRIEPLVDFATLSEVQRARSVKMGRKGKPGTSNVMRAMLKFPIAASLNEGFDIRQEQHVLTMRLYQFICERTCWLYDCEYLWSRHRLSAARDGITDRDLLAVAIGPANRRLQGLDRVFANAADELRYEHRLSDETWNAMRAYHPEAPADAIGVYGVYVLMCSFANSVGAVLEDGVPGFLPEILEVRKGVEPRASRAANESPSGAYPERLHPIDPVNFNQAQITALAPLRGQKIADTQLMRTFAHFPGFVTSIASIILRLNDCLLPPRLVHLGALRTAYLYGCKNLWAQEREACFELGVTEAEIFGAAVGLSSDKLGSADRFILTAMDELHENGWLSDDSWNACLALGEETPLDVMGLHALYAMMSVMASTLGVKPENGVPGFSPEVLASMHQKAQT